SAIKRHSVTLKKFSQAVYTVGSAISLSKGVQLVGGGKTLISTGALQRRAPSVYGGAGGYGTRISQSAFSSSGSLTPYGETAVINNEKVTMQNLNDRLSSYLDKVRSLESANRKLELQIREFYEKKAPSVSSDFTNYFATITELRAQIMRKHSDNQRIILQIDNAQLAADDFKIKYETELNMHTMVEADVFRLRGVRDSMTLNISDLEVQIEGLKEELVYMKTTHEEEKRQLKIQQTGMVNVEVDSTQSVDLTLVLQEIREQYEAMVVKNKQELEKWFQSKVELLNTQITTCTTEVKTFYTQLSELKRTLQTLEISRQSILTEQNKEEVNRRYSVQLSQQQLTINRLEIELQQLRVSLEQQQAEYNLLLDIKMRLELEIAEYRRLLEGESKCSTMLSSELKVHSKSVVVYIVELNIRCVGRRVKTIVEEIVDGKVVSSSVDTQVEDIQ
uniref:Keratin 99 n=1 Tax=Sander lucioperca TaxID=283035 RepID=A0A8C9Y8Z0_SANLU